VVKNRPNTVVVFTLPAHRTIQVTVRLCWASQAQPNLRFNPRHRMARTPRSATQNAP
jgi:hypothetical protein